MVDSDQTDAVEPPLDVFHTSEVVLNEGGVATDRLAPGEASEDMLRNVRLPLLCDVALVEGCEFTRQILCCLLL